jgi:type I restriction enzyme S subunit
MNVPRLRFKEFNGAWVEKKLYEISDIKTGPFGSTLHEADYVLSGTPIITVEHLGEQGVVHLNLPLVSDDDKSRLKSYHLKEGDVVFSRVGSVDRSCLISPKEDGWLFSGRLLRVRLTNNNFSPKFLNQNFKNDSVRYRIRSVAVGQTMASLNTEILKNFQLLFPASISEQTKIANFLTAVDEKITQLTRKADLLARYKKGVMQQIFSQQLRFKDDDGRDFPEWEVIELEKIAVKVNKKNKALTINEVLTNSATQGIVSQSDYFDRDIANQNNLSGYYVVEIDDFVYNPRISAYALVGPIKRNRLKIGVMSPLYTVFRFKEGNLDFFEQYFQTTGWHDYMKSVSNSGARHDRMNITNESFFGLPLPYPSKPEQTKIANFLTAIDDKITFNQTQLNVLKRYKQGLLQQLFV